MTRGALQWQSVSADGLYVTMGNTHKSRTSWPPSVILFLLRETTRFLLNGLAARSAISVRFSGQIRCYLLLFKRVARRDSRFRFSWAGIIIATLWLALAILYPCDTKVSDRHLVWHQATSFNHLTIYLFPREKIASNHASSIRYPIWESLPCEIHSYFLCNDLTSKRIRSSLFLWQIRDYNSVSHIIYTRT